LQARLAALELLREWKAPVQGLDPWHPETLTAPRLKDLQDWSGNPEIAQRTAPAQPPELSPAQLIEARRELARLLQASDIEAAAIRERLARHGMALLPEVYTQLKSAATDQARERLTALRYRLAASAALALDWPGGFDRLAATTASRRQQAAQELVARASAAEEGLLLELFSNPDPLVREISLRGLHKLAGRKATAALTRLLADPEPNVRAAVLKQLAEQPAPALVSSMRDYLAKEKDTDLIVHCLRVLRGIDSPTAVACLKEQLAHESWRVRAEAAEGLGEYLNRHKHDQNVDRVEIYGTLIDALKDSDGFVVGRALKGLRSASLAAMIEPMLQVTKTHPQLAPEVIAALASSYELRDKVIPHLRKFCAHEDPAVRAAAIQQLYSAASDVETEVRAALKDRDSSVRMAAANALYAQFEGLRYATMMEREKRRRPVAVPVEEPESGGLLSRLGKLFAGKKPRQEGQMEEKPADADADLLRLRAGDGRPAWVAGLAEPLQSMLAAAKADERLAAALPLVALGKEKEALPVLLKAAADDHALLDHGSDALLWLPWTERHEFYQQLLALRPDQEQLQHVVHNMLAIREPRTIPLFWDLAARADLKPELAGSLGHALKNTYFGGNENIDGQPKIPAAVRKEVVAAAKPRASAGPDLQRVIALALLNTASAEEAAALAGTIVEDSQAGAALRGDAFRVLLLGQERTEATKTALAALQHSVAGVRLVALSYLSGYTLTAVLDGNFYLDASSSDLNVTRYYASEGRPWVPDVPKGLKPEMLQPLLKDAAPEIQVQAAYLLTLQGEAAGLAPLLRYWREKGGPQDEGWTKAVYRAIAALGDDSRVPILEEIYRHYEEHNAYGLRDFYWTIRIMDTPGALKLRKQMRDEIGMSNLR
jgi:HEAT repeat protein